MTANETAQCCYGMAYYLLPQYAASEPEKVIDRLSEGRIGAMFFYFMACKLEGLEPGEHDVPAVTAFAAHHGRLDERNDYWIVQYPPPPKVDLSAEMNADDPATMLAAMKNIVLAPYFSALVRDKDSHRVTCFVLGQSIDGFTTLRTVNTEMNANLGRGCEPNLDAFLGLLRDQLAKPKEAVAALVYNAQPEKRWWQFWK